MEDYNILTNDGHCADYVPHKAIKNIMKAEDADAQKRIKSAMFVIRRVLKRYELEQAERFKLRDLKTKRVYK